MTEQQEADMTFLTNAPLGSDDPDDDDYNPDAGEYWAWYDAQESRRKDY
jgi:hypothetical protein